jgi:hypothetical protein
VRGRESFIRLPLAELIRKGDKKRNVQGFTFFLVNNL